jgi:phosphoglycolate phosphatase
LDLNLIQAVLFDKDGTLFDFQKTWGPWAVQVIARLAQDDAVLMAEVARVMGVNLEQQVFEADSLGVAGTPFDLVEALAPVLHHMSEEDILAGLMPNKGSVPLAHICDLPQTLSIIAGPQKRKLGLVTNDFEAMALEHLDQAGVCAAFDVVIGYDSGFGGKPASDGCVAAALALGVAPEHTLMVGDSLHDLTAGRGAGMQVVGVLTGTATRADLEPYADSVVQDITELAKLFSDLE